MWAEKEGEWVRERMEFEGLVRQRDEAMRVQARQVGQLNDLVAQLEREKEAWAQESKEWAREKELSEARMARDLSESARECKELEERRVASDDKTKQMLQQLLQAGSALDSSLACVESHVLLASAAEGDWLQIEGVMRHLMLTLGSLDSSSSSASSPRVDLGLYGGTLGSIYLQDLAHESDQQDQSPSSDGQAPSPSQPADDGDEQSLYGKMRWRGRQVRRCLLALVQRLEHVDQERARTHAHSRRAAQDAERVLGSWGSGVVGVRVLWVLLGFGCCWG